MKNFENITELFIDRDWLRGCSEFHHHQVFNNGHVYVYEVRNVNNDTICYEVFKRKIIADVKYIDGKFINSDTNGHVKYPCDEDFGRWAKNCISMKDENDRFDALYWIKEWTPTAQDSKYSLSNTPSVDNHEGDT